MKKYLLGSRALGDAKSAGKTVEGVKLAGALAAQKNGVTGTLKRET